MSAKEMVVRECRIRDLGVLEDLESQYSRRLLKGGGEAAAANVRRGVRAHYRRAMADPAQALLVADGGGRVLGFLHATQEDAPGDLVRAPWGCLAILVVDRAARRRGVGTALVRAAEAWAARRRLTALQLGVHEFNRGAIRFYEKLGYRPVMRLMQKAARAR